MDTSLLIILGLIAIVFILGFVASIYLAMQNPLAVLLILLAFFLFIVFASTIIFVIWWFVFRKKKHNINEEVKRDTWRACKATRSGVPKLATGLYVSGDRTSTGSYIGQVTGFTVRYYNTKLWAELTRLRKSDGRSEFVLARQGTKPEDNPEDYEEVAEVCFTWKDDRGMFGSQIGRLIGPEDIVVAIDYRKKGEAWVPSHSDLLGRITLFCTGIEPQGNYWYLNTQSRSCIPMITQSTEALLKTTFIALNEFHNVMQAGVDANVPHAITMEESNKVATLPFIPQGGQQQGGGVSGA